MVSDAAVSGHSISFLESLPTEILLEVVPHLDTHSMRDLLRAYRSFGRLVMVVLGPKHEGNGKPLFFTGFQPSIVHRSTLSTDDLFDTTGIPVRLFEIKCAMTGPFGSFFNNSLKNLKGMSFIHFTGDMEMMRIMCVRSNLDPKHPHTLRTFFQYNLDSLQNNLQPRLQLVALSHGSLHGWLKSQTHEHDSKKVQLSKRLTVIRVRGRSIKSLPLKRYLPHYYAKVSIDVPSAETTIQNIFWKHLKHLEIRFYKSNTVPTIKDLDLPRVQSFRIKYFRDIPLIMNVKAGYKSTSVGNVFEMLDTSVFDIHHIPSYMSRVECSDIHGSRMDLSFTRFFHNFVFAGEGSFSIYKLCGLENVWCSYWFDVILVRKRE